MLVLSRGVMERITIGDNVQIVIKQIKRGNVRIGIEAPRGMVVRRSELPRKERT